MRIKALIVMTAAILSVYTHAFAAESAHITTHDMAVEHGGGIFHMFRLEMDYGAGPGGGTASWDLDGWAGTDENKLWLKSEGERTDSRLESAEFWALYSRNIGTFWDAQAGIRYDTQPARTAYAVFGFNGLAPYFFETEAHVFISDAGDASARLREENDFLVTQKLILQPYAEINIFAQDVPKQDIGAGISDAQIGLQTRYEFTRTFAPYADIRYERMFGETSSIAESNGEEDGGLTATIGLRLMF